MACFLSGISAFAQNPKDYKTWAQSHELGTGFNDALADSDGDGSVDLLEYVWGSNPHVSDQVTDTAPSLSASPDETLYTYRVSDDVVGNAALRVLKSADLQDWTVAPGSARMLERHDGYTVYGQPVDSGQKMFYRLEAVLPAAQLGGGETESVVIGVGNNVGSAWASGIPAIPTVDIHMVAAPVSGTDATPNTSKYPSAAGSSRGSFTADLLQDYAVRNQRPPLRSWMGWFAWGDGTPPPGIFAGVHAPGQYGTYSGTGKDWDYFNYQWPLSTTAPDGGRSQGSWNPVRVDQQPLYLKPLTINYNWAPGPFGYESTPLKTFPDNMSYWSQKKIVRGVNVSGSVPFFYQYGNKLNVSSIPTAWWQAWLYTATRPLETTVIVPGNLKPTTVLGNGTWNQTGNSTYDPFPYPVWDVMAAAETQTPFSIKVDRIGDFDADLVWEAANPRDTNYYPTHRYRRTAFQQAGIGNYMKMTVSQGSPFVWCETNNSKYTSFYNLIRTNLDGQIASNTGTNAGVVTGGPWDVPGVTGVKYVLLYGDHVNPNQFYQEVTPWYFRTDTKQPGGFNPPPGSYAGSNGTTTAPGQHNHTYTAVFYREAEVEPVALGSNAGTDAQGNPYFYLEFKNTGKNWFVVGSVPEMRYYHTGVAQDSAAVRDQAARQWADTMGKYAFNFLTRTKIDYSVKNMYESDTTYSAITQNPYVAAGAANAAQMTANATSTVLTLNPHQYQPITLGPDQTKSARPQVVWNPLQSYGQAFPMPAAPPPNANKSNPSSPSLWGYWGLQGNLKAIISNSFTVAYPFQNFLPVMPPPDYSRQVTQTGIPAVLITNVGTGNTKITDAPVVTITDSSGKGSGATAVATIDANRGEILQIDVKSPGQGYPDGIPADTVTVTVQAPSASGGTTATAYAQTGGGKVLAIFMLDKGKGYSSIITATQAGSTTDPAIIIPNFDSSGNLLPGLATVVEGGAGYDFSQPITLDFFGTGTGVVAEVVKPGNILSIESARGNTAGNGNGRYPGSAPAPDVVLSPPVAGGTAQTAHAAFAPNPGDFQPAVINQGSHASATAPTAYFLNDGGQRVDLNVIYGQLPSGVYGVLDINLKGAPNNPPTITSRKEVVFEYGATVPTTPAVAYVYPTASVQSVSVQSPLVAGYNSPAQVAFVGGDFSDVPGVKIPKFQVNIPAAGGPIDASNIQIVDGGEGINYQLNIEVTGGLGFDAELKPIVNAQGGVEAVRVLQSGSHYPDNVVLYLSDTGRQSGTDANLHVEVTAGKITGVTVNNPGTGYTNALAVRLARPGFAAGTSPDTTWIFNPKGQPARFYTSSVNGTVTNIYPIAPPPETPAAPQASYLPGTFEHATVDSKPAFIWYFGNAPFARVTGPAGGFTARPAPESTQVETVLYGSIISEFTKYASVDSKPFGGSFEGLSGPDGYGLGNQLSAASRLTGDLFNLQQDVAAKGADFPSNPPPSYAVDAGTSPAGNYELAAFQQNNPFATLGGALKVSVQGLQRSLALLFQNPTTQNNPDPNSTTSWLEDYYAQFDGGVGRIVINPTATQPAWGVVSSVQNPTPIPALENGPKTGLSKWEKGMLWSGFGVSDQWNDQHYFYGYYIGMAALAGILDRSWEPSISGKPSDLWAGPGQMGTAVDQLIMTLAYDPDNAALMSALYKNTNLTYQKFAFFDQYNGHPWATGASPGSTTAPLDPNDPLGYWGAYGTISNKYNGENENSAFEGLQAWSATILWGGATDRKAVVDLGIYLYSTNLAAADAYFLDKNYNFPNTSENVYSWVPVTTIDSAQVSANGGNDGWPANTGFVESNPPAYYTAPEAFGGAASAGQSIVLKAERSLNSYFYAYPTGSRFIQAYPPTPWTLGISRNSDYARKWAGATMRAEWKAARDSALYQPADWLGMAMTSALCGVPYNPGDTPFPMTGPAGTPAVKTYAERLWSSWVVPNAAPGSAAALTPSARPTSILSFLLAFEDYGYPDWTYIAKATTLAGGEDNSATVFTATFTKASGPNSVDTTFVAFNPGWTTRYATFHRLDPNGSISAGSPASGAAPIAIPPKKLVRITKAFPVQ